MADKHFMDVQPDAGIVDFVHYDSTDDMVTTERVQDVEPILELNRAERLHDAKPKINANGFYRLGRIPSVIADDLHRKGILQNSERLRKWLLNPDNAAFLVRDPIDPV